MMGMKAIANAPLAPYTTLHVGGPAARLLVLEPGDELTKVLADLTQPVWVLGFGANVLISDQGLPGSVVLNRHGRISQISPTRLNAESGVNWDDLVQKSLQLQLYGLELTSGIPGGVGAAVVGNIAAYGQKVSDTLVEVTVLDSRDLSVTTRPAAELGLDYRSSNLQRPDQQHLVVLDATFELSTAPTVDLEYASALKVAKELGVTPDNLANRRQVIMETRRRIGSLQSDSAAGPYTAGSFFKNPVVNEDQVQAIIAHEEAGITRQELLRQNRLLSGNSVRVSAAHVLLAAGFSRGQRWGNVRLHPDHILKLENTGKATAQEMYTVVQEIVRTVQDKLGISIEPEVRFLGDFA